MEWGVRQVIWNVWLVIVLSFISILPYSITQNTYIYKWNPRTEHKTLTEINNHFVKIRDHCVMSKIGHGKVWRFNLQASHDEEFLGLLSYTIQAELYLPVSQQR